MNRTDGKTIPFDLPFRGGRTYLHSTSIFPALMDHFHPQSSVKLEFRELAHDPIFLSETEIADANLIGTFSFDTPEGNRSCRIYADSDRKVTDRIPCIEKDVVAAGQFHGDVAYGEIGRPGNFIETAVSLNKALVAAHVESEKKIVFSAIALKRVPAAGRLGVEITKKLGTKLFISDVSAGEEKIGTLTFMAV